MAANIEFNTNFNRYSFVENGSVETAWHGLGQVYDRPLTAVEALEGCNANFEVGLQPIVALTPELVEVIENGGMLSSAVLKNLIIDNRCATMRLDENKTLGVVSSSYGVVQNKHAFDFIDMLTTGELGGETPVIESAGLLGNGERIFITAKFPEPIRLGSDDENIDMYVVFTTSHDGSGCVSVLCTPIRVVCQNTLNLAMQRNSGKITFRHTTNVMSRMDLTNKENAKMAYSTLKLYDTYKTFLESKLVELAKQKVTDAQAEKILAHALFTPDNFKIYEDGGINATDLSTRSRNLLDSVKNSLYTGVGQNVGESGTGLWLINGLTTHFNNHHSWKDGDTKFKSILEGSVADKLNVVFNDLQLAA